jgi:hypothetical protein
MADTQFVQNIAQILLQAREQIRANMAAKGINASGRTSASLQVVQRGSKIALIKAEGQNAPFGTLQYGRAGGRVPRGFFYIIQQWTRDKGFNFENEKHRNAFTAYVVNKVKTKGTNRHETPNTQVYSEPIKKAVDGVRKEARKYILGNIKAALASGYTNTDL